MMLRSFLFVPGSNPPRFSKAFASAADAVIQDLEDSVAEADKAAARDAVAASLCEPADVRRYVRINGLDTPHCWDDLRAVAREHLHGLLVPKVESADQLRTLDWVLDQLEREHALEPGGIEILPILESACGFARLAEIAGASARVSRLTFGALDLCEDLDLVADAEEDHLAHVRWQLVAASRAAGLDAPIDTVFADIADKAGHARSLQRARARGFSGKLCIHPAQVASTNAAFMPTAAEIARARAIVAAVEQAGGDLGVAQIDGAMVDRPVILRAKRVLAVLGDSDARIADRPATRPTP